MKEVLDPKTKLRAICRKYSKDTSLSDKRRVWLVNYDDESKHYFCRRNDDLAGGPTDDLYFSIAAKDYMEEYAVTVLKGA